MAYLPLRTVALPEASERFFDGWLEQIGDRLSATGADWHRVTRDVLFEIWYPGLSDYEALVSDPATPAATRASLLSLDPHNITLEPEYYSDVDAERYARVKPLHWLWQSFDRSPLGGGNVHLGVGSGGCWRRISSRASGGTSSASSSSNFPTATTSRSATTA